MVTGSTLLQGLSGTPPPSSHELSWFGMGPGAQTQSPMHARQASYPELCPTLGCSLVCAFFPLSCLPAFSNTGRGTWGLSVLGQHSPTELYPSSFSLYFIF